MQNDENFKLLKNQLYIFEKSYFTKKLDFIQKDINKLQTVTVICT
jgi:hypothetical protein